MPPTLSRAVRVGSIPAAWPNTGNTGTTGSLTTHSGDLAVSTDNTVVSNLDISGQLLVRANGVSVVNCRIRQQGSSPSEGNSPVVSFGISSDHGYTGFSMTNCEISRPAGGVNGQDYGLVLWSPGVTLRACRIWNVTSGIQFLSTDVDMQDCMIDTLVNISGVDHNDCTIASGGVSNIVMRHNTLLNPNPQAAVIACYPESGANHDWAIDHNYIAGAGFCFYVSYTKGVETANYNFTVTNNHVGRDYYTQGGSNGPFDGGANGASFFDGAGNTWSGNVFDDDNTVINAI